MSGPGLVAGGSTPSGSAEVCDCCLRRGLLLGILAPRIQAVLDSRSRNPRSVLALGDRELLTAVGGDVAEAERFLREFDPESSRGSLAAANGAAVCRHSRMYPSRLLQLTDAPAVLFMTGDVGGTLPVVCRGPVVAVVGTRRPSPYGLEMATELGRGLGAAGVTVVSGMALGIDAAAHAGCLAGGGTTVAVLGGASDVVYPKSNTRIYERIRAEGLLMSEMPPGQRPYRWSFPARNRIMAGLSDATVVVEAARSSGSLITTDFAGDLGRAVCAVPGRATATTAQGSNELLRSGAAVINRVEDVLDEIFGAARDRPDVPEPVDEPRLDERERDVLVAVENDLGVDGICQSTGLTVPEARTVLSHLEAAGYIRRGGLGSYTRRPATR